MPGPLIEPFQSSDRLPETADVVIAGAGIIGLSAALVLAERGISVALCEKGSLACEQSSRNWGWTRQMGRDPRELPLIIEALRQWRQMNQRLGAETGFRQCGIAYLATTEAELAGHEAFAELARPYDIASRIIDGAAVADLLPGAAKRYVGALYTRTDGRAEPQLANTAIARAAIAKGAEIFTNCAVRGLETEAGRVTRVVTERGAIRCSAFLLAAGAWSRLFCQSLGITLPQLKVLSSVLRTAPLEGLPEISISDGGFAFRKRHDGGYTIAHGGASIAPIVPDSLRFMRDFLPALRMEWNSLRLRLGRPFIDEWQQPKRWALDLPSPFEAVRVLDPAPHAGILDEALAKLKAGFPGFTGLRVAQSWAGMIDVTPDAVPVISGVPDHPGLYVATGFSGHGFGIGPAAGQLAADLISNAKPIVDPAPFRFSRFSDGSRPLPMGGF